MLDGYTINNATNWEQKTLNSFNEAYRKGLEVELGRATDEQHAAAIRAELGVKPKRGRKPKTETTESAE